MTATSTKTDTAGLTASPRRGPTVVPFWQGARGPRALKRCSEFGHDICPSGLHDVFCAENQPINAQFDRNTGNSAAMTFVPVGSGNPRGPYAPSRERARFSSEFVSALLRDFRQGGPAAIAKVRKYQPAAYLKICALLVPKEMKLEHSAAALKALSDEQLEQAIEMVKEMMEARAGDEAKLIEGATETVALPAPAESRAPKRKPNRLLQHADTAVGQNRKAKVVLGANNHTCGAGSHVFLASLSEEWVATGPRDRKPRKRVPSPPSA
jgi:hypothetical protein